MTSRVEKTTTTRSSSRPPPSIAPSSLRPESIRSGAGTPSPSSVFPPSIPLGEIHSSVTASDGTRLFVRSKPAESVPVGSEKTVLFCDGIVCDGFIWKYLWNDLAADGKTSVAHFHYRGHGRSASPADPDRIDIEAHADDVWSVRQQIGVSPCVLIGHSMGCQVALEAYHRHPENVRALVLICGTFGRVTKTVRGVPVVDMILPKLLAIADKRPELVRALWSRLPSEMAVKVAMRAGEVDPERIREEDVLPYLQHLKHVDFPMFLRMLRAAGEHTAENYLGAIEIPVLIIAGEKDTLTPPYLSQAMAAALPNAELMMVAHGTHAAALEQPALIGEKIRAFLDAHLA